MSDELESEYAARYDDHAERWASEREDVRRQDLADSKERGPVMSGRYEGGGVWNMYGVAGARCDHCGRFLTDEPGGAAHVVEVTDDLYTAFDFNEERVEPTAKRACRDCVRGLNYAGRRDDGSIGASEDDPVGVCGHEPDPPACACGDHIAGSCPVDGRPIQLAHPELLEDCRPGCTFHANGGDLVEPCSTTTWFQASWTVPGVGRIYGPIYTERRKAVLSVPGFGSTASDLHPLIDESDDYADMHERTHCNACNNTPHMLLCTTCGARGEPGVLPIER